MSLTVEVIRGEGDRTGPEITCGHWSSEQVFRQAGRVAIDQAAQGIDIASVTLFGTAIYPRPGQLVRIVDVEAEYVGQVVSVLYSRGRAADGTPSASCSMELRLLVVS